MNKVGIGKVGIGILAALIAISTASAHMGWGYSYGGMGGYSYGGYGMPMIEYRDHNHGNQEIHNYKIPMWDGIIEQNRQNRFAESITVEGKVIAVYPMHVLLDNGYNVFIPWWFSQQVGIFPGDEIKVSGFKSRTVIPNTLEINGIVYEINSKINLPNSYPPQWSYGHHIGYSEH